MWTKVEGEGLRHCVASERPIWFTTSNTVSSDDLDSAIKASFFPSDPLLVRRLEAEKFLLEKPSGQTWELLSSMIYRICNGVSLNFHLSDELKEELIHEAFTQTLTKIRRGKLIFNPGRAPAFNLLTTAIFRIMYSIKNKEKRDRDKRAMLVDQLLNGSALPDLDSIRVSRSLIANAIKP